MSVLGINNITNNQLLVDSRLPERPNIASYKEMVCRIPKADLSKIESKMASLNDLDSYLEIIHGQLETGDYHSLHEDAFYYALRGVKEGKIESKVVTRISDIETLRLQGIQFKVVDFLEICPDPRALKHTIYQATGKHLYDEQLDQFIAAYKELPKEDRLLMIFEPKRGKLKQDILSEQYNKGNNPTTSQAIESKQKMNILNRIKHPEKPGEYLRIFSSLELYQTFLNVKFGKKGVQGNPVLGISTPAQIERNGLTSSRDIAHFYLVPKDFGGNELVTFPEADGFICEENDFNYHDRYHAFVTSSIGPDGRLLSVSIGKKLKNYAIEQKENMSPQDYRAMRFVRWQFVDMDFPQGYRFERNARVKNQPLFEHQKDPVFILFQSMFQNYESIFYATQEEDNSFTIPFETTEALEVTYAFIDQNIPDTPEIQSVRKLFIEKYNRNIELEKEKYELDLSLSVLLGFSVENRKEKRELEKLNQLQASFNRVFK